MIHVDRRVSGSVLDREATIEVISWMRGDGDFSINVVMPYNAPYIDTDWSTVPGIVVKGYSVVVFLDDQMRVVEGNGLFFTDGEYLWRNKRSELFLHPQRLERRRSQGSHLNSD